MAGVRTAPDVTGAATYRQLHVRWIDNSGDITSEAYLIPAAATNTQIEAMLDALQAGSNASLFETSISTHFGGDAFADVNNADYAEEKSTSVFDRMFATWKNTNPEIAAKRVSIPAPIGALFLGDGVEVASDTPDPASAELVALFGATLAVFGAGWDVAWVRYVERREINEKTRV